MPLSQAARIARLKAAEEQNRAAQQAAAVRDHAGGHQRGPGPDRIGHDGDRGVGATDMRVTARRAAAARQGSGTVASDESGNREPQAPSQHRTRQTADLDRNLKAEAAVERLKDLLDAKNQIRDEARGDSFDETAEHVADRPINAAQKHTADQKSVRDQKGLFVAGNPGGPGRPRGSKNTLPRGSRKMMKELIAGRVTQDGRPIATIMVDLFFQGLEGGVVLRRLSIP